MVSSSAPTPRSGVHYFSQGWKLIGLPGIRRYVFLPLLVNVLLMGGAFWWLFTRLNSWIPSLMSHVPDWLQWLNYLLWPVVVLSILLVFGYFFSTIANWIAAPFSGLLAEQLEARLTGATPPDVGVFGIMKDIPRIMKREWQKLAWYLPAPSCCCCSTLYPALARRWLRYSGSCSAHGCWRFNTAITPSITTRFPSGPCAKRCAAAR